MSLDIIFNILMVGEEKEIRSLEGSSVHYEYFPSTGGFRVKRGEEMVIAHKIFYPPNCVICFGNKHSFSTTPSA